ncbi:hypothetical protein FOA52_013262 [Chlamydomonas sp. UWO 241]|nr:hypothetical protein FOA52_013262 [Chlamydomonas sp. UWO 241]
MRVMPLQKIPPRGSVSQPVAEGAMEDSSESVPTGPAGKLWGGYLNAVGSVTHGLSWASRKSGQFSANRPWWMIAATLVIGALCCVPWGTSFKYESDPNVLWVPRNSKAAVDGDFVAGLYPFRRPGASFYAQLQPDKYAEFGGSENALVLPVTWEMFQLDTKIRAISVEGANGSNITYADICEQTSSGSCVTSGYLNFWDWSFATFVANVSGSTTDRKAGNNAAFQAQATSTTYPDSQSVQTLVVFGGVEFAYTPAPAVSATNVIGSDYWINGNVRSAVADRWSRAVTDLLLREMDGNDYEYMTFTFIAATSVGDELSVAITGDMFLIVVSFILYIAMAVILLSKLDSVLTRTSLALLGILVIVLGVMAGWGLGILFGMPFTPLQQLSPFILIGMGVDVLFVLVKSYEIIVERTPSMTMSAAFGQLMATSGVSVVITLLASILAFALGVVNELNSVRWFAGFAALNTLGICFFMVTTFVALFALNERRAALGRRDFICCAPCARKSVSPALPGSPEGSSQTESESFVKCLFRVHYAPALTNVWVKLAVVVLFSGGIAVAFIGITKMKFGQPITDLVPDGSYLKAYEVVQMATYENQVGPETALYFRGLDWSLPSTQAKMLTALGMALSTSHINASTSVTQGNWYIEFNQYAAANGVVLTSDGGCVNPYIDAQAGDPFAAVVASSPTLAPLGGCVPQADYYTALAAFLPVSSTAANDVIFESSNAGVTITGITSCRMALSTIPKSGLGKYEAELFNSQRAVEVSINDEVFAAEGVAYGDDVVFSWNFQYKYYEGDAILPRLTWQYFVLSLAGIGFIVLIMLVHPLTALLLVIAVGMVILFLFGELWVLGIRFNQVSVINMIMATGLATDYTVYFVQKFMTVSQNIDGDNSRNGRMVRALAETGSAVFLGGFTALIGTVPMAFAKSTIIRTFFFLIFGTILFALLIGLMLMPVVFSCIGPGALKSSLMDDDDVVAADDMDASEAQKKGGGDVSITPTSVSLDASTSSSDSSMVDVRPSAV